MSGFEETVLLVDDSAADRARLRLMLGRGGSVVHEVATGREALVQARELRPHAVLLDLNLPGLDGLEVCQALRADPQCAGVSILLMTTAGRPAVVAEGLEAGADDFVSKDDPPEVLLARVRRLVRYRQLANSAILNEQLAQVGRLLAGIIHEIRSPLAIIRGNAELLRLVAGQVEGVEDYLEPILRTSQLLQVRLEHLMAAVRGGSGARLAMDVAPLVREAAELFRKSSDPITDQVAVEASVAPGLPAVLADAGRLIQVFLNLLGNAREAIQAVRPEGRIKISVRPETREGRAGVAIEVSDNGPGIPEAYLGRIFEPFFTTKSGGSGYGLYLASEIVREQGGQLLASNEPGGGARFTVWLPPVSDRPVT